MRVSYLASLCSGGQNLAALSAAAGENLAAVSSSHSLAEAMNLGTVALGGLVGTLHSVHLLSFCTFMLNSQKAVAIDYN